MILSDEALFDADGRQPAYITIFLVDLEGRINFLEPCPDRLPPPSRLTNNVRVCSIGADLCRKLGQACTSTR